MSDQVESHRLGSLLRSTYFDTTSPSYIEGIRSDLVDNNEVKVRVKAGVEGTVVFDSAISLLQGLFPPTPNNKIVLANETVITAPLGGYQYVPGKLMNALVPLRFTCFILCMYSRNCGTWQRSLFGKLDQLPCETKTIL